MDSYAISGRTAIYNAQQYAISCYRGLDGFNPDNSSASCSSHVVPWITSTINRTATCPFAEKACDASTLSLDSELIDSSIHLGINAPPKDRVQVRRNMTCAPIPLEREYSLPWNDSDPSGEKLFQLFKTLVSLNSDNSNRTFGIANTTLSEDGRPYDPV
jgi:hypothetical protein